MPLKVPVRRVISSRLHTVLFRTARSNLHLMGVFLVYVEVYLRVAAAVGMAGCAAVTHAPVYSPRG